MPSPTRNYWQPPSRVPWKLWGIILLIAAGVLGAELVWIKTAHKKTVKSLPVLATVPDFSFTSETGVPVTRESLLGKIWIANFIFTRCAGPCPLMTEKMRQLQVSTRTMANGDVHLISLTVDPTYDTPEILAQYGARVGSNPDRWHFLTGDPKEVENFVTKGMLLGLSKDGQSMPVHSQKFVVVDRKGAIRAYHDFEDPVFFPNLLADIEALGRESYTPEQNP